MLVLAFAACAREAPPAADTVLLYAGAGTSPNDVVALETLLRAEGVVYAKIEAAGLAALDPGHLAPHRLLIVPGGDFERMGQALGVRTAANVRSAVHGGLNYLGICAGAFLAGRFGGSMQDLGFDLAGVQFPFHSLAREGIRKAAVAVAAAGEPVRDHYWEDGPALGGFGEVVARYPDGAAAVAQGRVGAGWALLCGFHPEAPASWRGDMAFHTSAEDDNAYARRLLAAALHATPLAHW